MTTPSAPRISDDELARLEELAGKATPSWYRGDIADINNPDAAYIAALSPDVVLRLIAAARSAPAAGLDVERLARAFHAKNERTAAAFDGVPSCDHDDDRPECVGEAEAIAREYAALAAEEVR